MKWLLVSVIETLLVFSWKCCLPAFLPLLVLKQQSKLYKEKSVGTVFLFLLKSKRMWQRKTVRAPISLFKAVIFRLRQVLPWCLVFSELVSVCHRAPYAYCL